MIEVLTGLLVLITGFYAWVTYKMLHANRDVVALMLEQTEAMTRPYVAITAYLPPEGTIFILKISNTGKTPAKKLKLILDKEFHKYGRDGGNSRFSEFIAFKEEIESFPPGAEIFFDLAQGFNFFGDQMDENLTPPIFSITAQYSYANKNVTEKNTIDLRPYYMSNLPNDPFVSELKVLTKTIDKTGDKIKRAIEEMSKKQER